MREVVDADSLSQQIEVGAALVLFGGRDCAVCKSLRPQLESRLSDRFPELQLLYVDCAVAPVACAQFGVFSVPVVQVYFEGDRFVERVRVFSLSELIDAIDRPYRLWAGPDRIR